MNHKIISRLLFLLSTCYTVFFVYASLNMMVSNFWGGTFFAAVFIAAYIAEIHLFLHWKHADNKEKHRVLNQRPIRGYFYNRWYTPADSTELENQEEKLQKIKRVREKKIHRK